MTNDTMTVEKLRDIFIKGQLPESFGVEIIESGKDFVTASLTVDQRHLRPGGIMNGGVSLVLIETVGSMSSCLFIDLEKKNALGIQVSANHLSIARPGEKLTAKSKAIHIGKTTHLWEVIISNEKEKVISTGRITMLIADK